MVQFCLLLWMIFFFQAEDGIRDLVRSRGLGDVYKRQVSFIPLGGIEDVTRNLYVYEYGNEILLVDCGIGSVSYTHLTLPTSDLV